MCATPRVLLALIPSSSSVLGRKRHLCRRIVGIDIYVIIAVGLRPPNSLRLHGWALGDAPPQVHRRAAFRLGVGCQRWRSEAAGSALTTDRKVGQGGAQFLLRCCCDVAAVEEVEVSEGGEACLFRTAPHPSRWLKPMLRVAHCAQPLHLPRQPHPLRLRQPHSNSEAGAAHRSAQPHGPWLESSPPFPNTDVVIRCCDNALVPLNELLVCGNGPTSVHVQLACACASPCWYVEHIHSGHKQLQRPHTRMTNAHQHRDTSRTTRLCFPTRTSYMHTTR